MRKDNSVYIWILVSDTLCPQRGDAQIKDRFSAYPDGLLGGPASPYFPHPPCAPHMPAQHVWGLQYMKLTSCYDKYCK